MPVKNSRRPFYCDKITAAAATNNRHIFPFGKSPVIQHYFFAPLDFYYERRRGFEMYRDHR
jgi:hypothetical protein